MRPVSGKEYAKIVERRGWTYSESREALIFTASPAAKLDYRSQFTKIRI